MGFSVSRTVWLENGYGVEFIVTEPFSIDFNIITERNPIMVSSKSICVGSDSCARKEGESLKDFAIRAREEGISFAETTIIEHKETLDLITTLNVVLGASE